MIKQRIILKYIVTIVIIVSVLGVGITIFKQGNGVKQNKPTQGAEAIKIDKKLAIVGDKKLKQNAPIVVEDNKINTEVKNKKQTTADGILPNPVDLNIKKPSKGEIKTPSIDLKITEGGGDNGASSKKTIEEPETTAPINNNVEPNTDLVISEADKDEGLIRTKKEVGQGDLIVVENSNSNNKISLENTKLKMVDLVENNIKPNTDAVIVDDNNTNTKVEYKVENKNSTNNTQTTKSIPIVMHVGIFSNMFAKIIQNESEIIEELPSTNTSSDKESEKEQTSDDENIDSYYVEERLKKTVRGYYYQHKNRGFVYKYINTILYILKLAVPESSRLYSRPNIKKIKTIWMENADRIIDKIKTYPRDALGLIPTILQNVDNPDIIYNNLSEFLFLYYSRTIKEILKDAFSNHVSIVEIVDDPFTRNAILAAYNTCDHKSLKDLYYNNLQGQLYMFIGAIYLINHGNNQIIKDMNKATVLAQSRFTNNKKENKKDMKYSNTDIIFITVIRIILDIKLDQNFINTSVLKLTENLLEDLIKLITKFTDLYYTYNTNNIRIEPTTLIDLIRKVYNGSSLEKEKDELNRILTELNKILTL